MRIMHVIVGLGVGGAELMLQRLIEHQMQHSDCQHWVVSLTDAGSVGEALIEKGVSVTTLNMGGYFSAPYVCYELYKLISNSQPDVVQTWMYHADLIGGLAARLAGIKNIVWGVRTTDLNSGGKKATILVRKICSLLSKIIPKVIVCSAEASRREHVAIGYDGKRTIVIPNGFDLSRLNASSEQGEIIRLAAGIGVGEIVIGSLGRFNPVKDHATFVAAAAVLATRYSHVKFLLIGRGLDSNNAELMRIIKSTGQAERFVLLGERQDVAACLKAMDVFCLHSQTEGFPNVLGEAMAMGLPCVTTNVGDAAYLLDGNGVVVPSRDPRALAKGIESILNMDAVERSALGRSAMSRIHCDFTISRASENFKSLYEAITYRGEG